MLKIENACFNRGAREIFKDVSAYAKHGEIILLTGENGSGKTTLLNCICGQLEIHSGSIEFKDELSYVPDDGGTIPLLTVDEQLHLHCQINSVPVKEINQRTEQVIDMLNLSGHKDFRASELSSGLRKKLGIGLCINKNAGLYLFDEPFNSLDTQSAALLARLIRLLKQNNKTLIIATHDPALIESDCDRIWDINNGSLMEITDKEKIKEFIRVKNEVFDKRLAELSKLALRLG